ncbi:MAG TPA: histidinol dehydrogenase [Lachnospiraceae bacterium]|nr:histidinol dehydrogenase [Lachnospiraceae bacterium]HCS00504.1 histidinol dehydrogenase [Lachnospiraceae bacterium]
MRTVKLNKETKKDILANLLKRSTNDYGEIEERVKSIIERVRTEGDSAVYDYARQFDRCDLNDDSFMVTEAEIEEGAASIDSKLYEVMERSFANIRSYHEKQVRQSFFTTRDDGSVLGQRITPIRKVGVYVPGGKAAYPSTVLMNITPALCAGVPEIIMCTPAGPDGRVTPVVLAAAKITGVKKIFKTGGAQAIAAMAYGTDMIPKVDKIVGPGNIYVALAKRAVYGHVSIDSVAGPSEVMVLADETADPRYVAADLLSQAEHDEMASAILVTTSEELAAKVSEEIDAMIPALSRREIIEKSLDNYGYALIADNMEDAIDVVNDIASEHLEIVTADPWGTMTKVKNAGAIFLGEYSSEPLGDYFAGPNHVLPTNGTAKFFSPLSVDDFIKKSSVICYSKEALESVHEDVEVFAKSEGLTAHANSVAVRFK